MTFEWDERKNAANRHGVSLETASLIFKGAIVTRIDGRTDYGELREVSIGKVGAAFLTVVHTDREGRTRIISARPANRAERKRYEEAL